MSEFLHSILYSPDSGYAAIRCIILAAACYAIIVVSMSLARRFGR